MLSITIIKALQDVIDLTYETGFLSGQMDASEEDRTPERRAYQAGVIQRRKDAYRRLRELLEQEQPEQQSLC